MTEIICSIQNVNYTIEEKGIMDISQSIDFFRDFDWDLAIKEKQKSDLEKKDNCPKSLMFSINKSNLTIFSDKKDYFSVIWDYEKFHEFSELTKNKVEEIIKIFNNLDIKTLDEFVKFNSIKSKNSDIKANIINTLIKIMPFIIVLIFSIISSYQDTNLPENTFSRNIYIAFIDSIPVLVIFTIIYILMINFKNIKLIKKRKR